MSTQLYLYGMKKLPGSFTNVLAPFPLAVWIGLLTSFASMVAAFLLIHRVYRWAVNIDKINYSLGHENGFGSHFGLEGLAKTNISPGDLALRTFATLTEPDRFLIFPAWSAGDLFSRFRKHKADQRGKEPNSAIEYLHNYILHGFYKLLIN